MTKVRHMESIAESKKKGLVKGKKFNN